MCSRFLDDVLKAGHAVYMQAEAQPQLQWRQRHQRQQLGRPGARTVLKVGRSSRPGATHHVTVSFRAEGYYSSSDDDDSGGEGGSGEEWGTGPSTPPPLSAAQQKAKLRGGRRR